MDRIKWRFINLRPQIPAWPIRKRAGAFNLSLSEIFAYNGRSVVPICRAGVCGGGAGSFSFILFVTSVFLSGLESEVVTFFSTDGIVFFWTTFTPTPASELRNLIFFLIAAAIATSPGSFLNASRLPQAFSSASLQGYFFMACQSWAMP